MDIRQNQLTAFRNPGKFLIDETTWKKKVFGVEIKNFKKLNLNR